MATQIEKGAGNVCGIHGLQVAKNDYSRLANLINQVERLL